ncbi:MAG: sugar ABC transporter substrate-binding protein [Bauldia sp.]|nr:sugar ABC transporter substrate-binding protein [Bauldia sp.]
MHFTKSAVIAAALLLGGGIGSWAADEAVTIDVGNGKTVEVTGPIRLAYFAPGSNNSWLQAAIKGVEDAIAKVPGASVTVFDAQWDGVKQFNQVQNALQSGQFNVGLIDPVNSQLMCNIVSKDAADAGVVMSNFTHPICDRYPEEGEARYTPGTLNYVDANDTVGELKAYIKFIVEQNPGKQKMVTISGPPIDGMTKNLQTAFAQLQEEGLDPDFDISNLITTNFSLAEAHSKLGALLQANPDVTIVWAPATSDVAQGGYAALKELGRVGEVKVYEKGGSPWAIEMLRKGEINGSQPQYPYTIGRIAVEQIADAFAGKTVPTFVPDYGVEYNDVDKARGFQFLDQEAAQDFQSEY